MDSLVTPPAPVYLAAKIKFSDSLTESSYSKRSFVYDFLSSMRQKINDPLGVRAKKRKQLKRQ